jgi:poly(rC)-binding protein 2/3/4
VLYSQAGWLLGKGGSVIKQMSVDNDCEIRVSKDKLPSCALPNDRLCQVHFPGLDFIIMFCFHLVSPVNFL